MHSFLSLVRVSACFFHPSTKLSSFSRFSRMSSHFLILLSAISAAFLALVWMNQLSPSSTITSLVCTRVPGIKALLVMGTITLWVMLSLSPSSLPLTLAYSALCSSICLPFSLTASALPLTCSDSLERLLRSTAASEAIVL